MTLQIATANRLRNGAVVYLGSEGRWSERISDAVAATDTEHANDLLRSAIESDCVIGAYLMPVDATPGGMRPSSVRERIRAEGGPRAPQPAYSEPAFPSLAGLAG